MGSHPPSPFLPTSTGHSHRDMPVTLRGHQVFWLLVSKHLLKCINPITNKLDKCLNFPEIKFTCDASHLSTNITIPHLLLFGLLLAGHPSRVLEGSVEQVIVHDEGILGVVKNQVFQRWVDEEWLSKSVPMLTLMDLAMLNILVAPVQ
ncbi:hypothetical protein E2C01_019249 [Portunus trituberculatus]|uniref:Uncharacterized protein n=1 Tax=Portunus trituberculatus TaxID=210409 RepID=A0A5B7DYI7_PORTR|nr:hypothetical protein [Portunus trituberculatus]